MNATLRYGSLVTLLLLISAGVTSARAQDNPETAESLDIRGLWGLNEVHRLPMNIEHPARNLSLFVRLPENYRRDDRYPTLYILDGGLMFPLLAAYYQYLRASDAIPPMLLVGISYGTIDWQAGNQRGVDFTLPADSRDHWGGAESFHQLLATRIIPEIETRYAADSKQRILIGQSLGGQFVLYCALLSPDLFQGYISSNPALHRNLVRFLQKPVKTSGLPTLFVSRAAEEFEEFRTPSAKWMAHWEKEHDLPFHLKTEVLPGHDHFSSAPEAFRRGLLWYFEQASP